MAGRRRIPQKDLEFMAKDIGPELLPFLDPQEILKHHPQLTREVLTMAGKRQIPQKDLEFVAKDIGPELLPFLDPQEILRRLSPEQRQLLKQLLEKPEQAETKD